MLLPVEANKTVHRRYCHAPISRHAHVAKSAAILLLLTCMALLSPCGVAAAEGHSVANAASGTPAKVVQPLPLPTDPKTSCSKAVFQEFSYLYRNCARSMYHDKNPDELCCRGLSEYFGINSTRPSRNCFCVPEVMQPLVDQHDYHYIHFEENFKYCGLKYGHVVPFYQSGSGYCNGTQDDPVDITSVDIEYIAIEPTPAFSEWSSRLDKDWLMLTSFMAGIVSVPGFFIFMWPFMYDMGFTVMDASAKFRSPKRRL